MNASILKRPIITEKSLDQARTANKYTFEVARTANKDQIVEAVESLFGVSVQGINTIQGHRVRKATGRKRMRTIVAPTKKAIVKLKKGDSIDLFEFGESQAS